MGSGAGCRLFRTWSLHDERQRDEAQNDNAQDIKRICKAQHTRLQIDPAGKLRQGVVRGLNRPNARGCGASHQSLVLLFEKRVAMVGVRGKGGAMNLILAGKEGREQRDSRAPTDVAHKVADAGNLVELVARHAYIVERADGDKDERDSDDLDNAVFNNGPEGDAVVNGCCVIEPNAVSAKPKAIIMRGSNLLARIPETGMRKSRTMAAGDMAIPDCCAV